MEEIAPDSADLTSEEQSVWESLSEDTALLSLRLVRVSSLEDVLDGDALLFQIPGTQDTVLAVGMYLHYLNDTTYAWWGAVMAGKGYVGVSATTEGRLVNISFKGNNYLIHPLSYRYNAQTEIDGDAISSEEPEIGEPEYLTVDPDCEMDSCKDVVNILVLYTPEAVNQLFYFFDTIQKSNFEPLYWALFPQTLNYAFIQSGIVGKRRID